MITFPNAKINMGLHITGRRADGYHNIETVFYPVPVKDILEIISDEGNSVINFTSSGNKINGNPEDNLCVNAYRLLKKHAPDLPGLHLHLHKHIPAGAGMGGGSADAAAVLKLVNSLFKLNLSQAQLLSLALELGSDCPFFILNTPALAKGRGEELTSIDLNLSGFSVTVVYPNIHVSTAAAFAGLNGNYSTTGEVEKAILGDIFSWRDTLHNDFEPFVFAIHPILAEIKQGFYDQGAIYSAMSGSGSSIYGIFPAGHSPVAKYPADWFCQTF